MAVASVASVGVRIFVPYLVNALVMRRSGVQIPEAAPRIGGLRARMQIRTVAQEC